MQRIMAFLLFLLVLPSMEDINPSTPFFCNIFFRTAGVAAVIHGTRCHEKVFEPQLEARNWRGVVTPRAPLIRYFHGRRRRPFPAIPKATAFTAVNRSPARDRFANVVPVGKTEIVAGKHQAVYAAAIAKATAGS